MIGNILLGLFLIFAIIKFYKNRETFKQLSKKEWFQYIVVLLLAFAVVGIIIIGGFKLTDLILISWLEKTVRIMIALVALTCAGFIMNKALPEKLKAFYS